MKKKPVDSDSDSDSDFSEEETNPKGEEAEQSDVEGEADDDEIASLNSEDRNLDDDDDDEGEGDGLPDNVRIPVLNPLSLIKNKDKRRALFKKVQQEKKKKQKADRRNRRKQGLPANPGHTIESLREKDETTVNDINDEDNEELREDLENDEFSEYFRGSYEPKILVTFADNPVTKTRLFGIELSRIFPNTLVKVRNRSSVKKICKSAEREGFTDVIIVNEDRRQPNGLLIMHLPDGPTAHFKVSNVKLTKEIKRDHKEITKHRPELILTNFTTRLGLTIGRMFACLFHHDPEFVGRRAVTFHNQRDYIFFRHHRYEFKDGKRVKLRELGPRFTLKLRSLQEGTFDSKHGDYTWIIANKRHAMESRRRFFL
ncbi:F44G4.1 family protein [Megaselia abdita]